MRGPSNPHLLRVASRAGHFGSCVGCQAVRTFFTDNAAEKTAREKPHKFLRGFYLLNCVEIVYNDYL